MFKKLPAIDFSAFISWLINFLLSNVSRIVNWLSISFFLGCSYKWKTAVLSSILIKDLDLPNTLRLTYLLPQEQDMEIFLYHQELFSLVLSQHLIR